MNKGEKIETDSFDIIDKNCDLSAFSEIEKAVVKRLIHTTGDFEFADMTVFSDGGCESGVAALQSKKPIICDVNMVKTGITKKYLDACGVQTFCFINDEDVISAAKEKNMTRAECAVLKAAELYPDGIYAVGNAPTALLKILELADGRVISPSLIVGLPVGFVMAAESKEMLAGSKHNFITNTGTKGGSPCARASVNALVKYAWKI